MEWIAGWLVLAAVGSAPSSSGGPCALLARDSIAAVQGARVVSVKESGAKAAEVERRSCFFETDPFAKSVSLEWTKEIAPGAARRRWDRTFHAAKEDEEDEKSSRAESREKEEGEHERPAKPPEPVPGVGDEAFWVASPASGAFYAIAGSSSVRISVGGPGGATDKRERSKKLAREAVKALESREK